MGPGSASELARRRCAPEAVLEPIDEGAGLIVGLANGEPVSVLDAIEAGVDRLRGVRSHQMLPLRERAYMKRHCPGASPRLVVPLPADAGALPRGNLRPRAQ